MSEAELIASMDAWLHAECGLDNMRRAQYTPQELDRLRLGYMVREQQRAGTRQSGDTDQHRRKLKSGHQKARDDMLDDLGFD